MKRLSQKPFFYYLPLNPPCLPVVFYFRIMVTNFTCILMAIYPLSNFPQGGKVLFLPPWGKARMGVSKRLKKSKNLLTLKCYRNCEELHGRQAGFWG